MHHFRLLFLAALTALFSLAGQAFAQTTTLQTLGGSRHAGPGAVNSSSSSFGLGISRDNGATFVSTATVAETVLIRGEVRPEAANVGLPADIYVVDRLLDNNSFLMRTQSGVWVTWNGAVSTLQPFRDNETLDAVETLDLFTGTLGTAGNHRFFLGYMPADGILRYHVNGLAVTITAQQQQTPLEQANALFASKISPNIVQANCIACHVSGGSASGLAMHTFVPGSGSSQLSTNFTQFRNLFIARGSSLILSKVTGGTGHGGGAVMSSTSQEFSDLEQFLTLLGQL